MPVAVKNFVKSNAKKLEEQLMIYETLHLVQQFAPCCGTLQQEVQTPREFITVHLVTKTTQRMKNKH